MRIISEAVNCHKKSILDFIGLAATFLSVVYLVAATDLSFILHVPMRMNAAGHISTHASFYPPDNTIIGNLAAGTNAARAAAVCLECRNIPVVYLSKVMLNYGFPLQIFGEISRPVFRYSSKIPHPPRII